MLSYGKVMPHTSIHNHITVHSGWIRECKPQISTVHIKLHCAAVVAAKCSQKISADRQPRSCHAEIFVWHGYYSRGWEGDQAWHHLPLGLTTVGEGSSGLPADVLLKVTDPNKLPCMLFTSCQLVDGAPNTLVTFAKG